jgi:hypothetical protein
MCFSPVLISQKYPHIFWDVALLSEISYTLVSYLHLRTSKSWAVCFVRFFSGPRNVMFHSNSVVSVQMHFVYKSKMSASFVISIWTYSWTKNAWSCTSRSRSSSVSIKTRLWAGRPDFSSWQVQWWDFFYLGHSVQTSSGACQASYSVCTGVLQG